MRSRPRRILLAQNLLGLPDQEPRSRSKTLPPPPDHQHGHGTLHARLGMATRSPRRQRHPPFHRSETRRLALDGPGRIVALPGDESGHLLHDCDGGVFLGV